MVNKFEQDGIRVMNYVNPMFMNISEWANEFDGVNYFQTVIDSDYAVRRGDDKQLATVYGSAVLIDLYNEKARNWMKSLIRDSVISDNISGFLSRI